MNAKVGDTVVVLHNYPDVGLCKGDEGIVKEVINSAPNCFDDEYKVKFKKHGDKLISLWNPSDVVPKEAWDDPAMRED